jgi:hypothetical protein
VRPDASRRRYLGDRRAAGTVEVEALRTLRRWMAELDAEPGAVASGITVAPPGAELSLFELSRIVQLKGLCTAERAAAALGVEDAAVEGLVAENEPLFRTMPRGLMLTPDGRVWLLEQLAAERNALPEDALGPCYTSFLGLNERFKRLVSSWQQAGPAGAPSATQLAELVATLEALHGELQPLIAESGGRVPRLSRYTNRFEAALAWRLRAPSGHPTVNARDSCSAAPASATAARCDAASPGGCPTTAHER